MNTLVPLSETLLSTQLRADLAGAEAEDAARRLADCMAGTAKPPVVAPPQKPEARSVLGRLPAIQGFTPAALVPPNLNPAFPSGGRSRSLTARGNFANASYCCVKGNR
jgi:hypothetical protein